jgi:ACS family hexuronate transporter-like MFS transporter
MSKPIWAGLRWRMILLMMLGGVLNYLSRSTLSVAAPTLMHELHVSTAQYSWVTGIFSFTLMFQPLCGYVLDVLGLKVGFAIFATVWSLVCMAHGLVTNWQMLAGLRGVLGLAEGCANPAGMKGTAEWFPARERGLAGGIYNIGASAGSMLAPPLVAWMIVFYSWQIAFVAVGLVGLIWVAAWLIFFHSPARHPSLSAEERDYILSGQEKHLAAESTRPPVWKLLGRRNFWGIALPRFLADPTWGTLYAWVPLYLVTVRHFDLRQIALFAWLPFLAADLGCIFGPSVVLALQRRGVTLITARKLAFTLGALMMTGVVFTGLVNNPYMAVALLSLAGFAHQTLSVTVITMASDLFKRSEVATVAGLAGTCGNLGITIFTLLLGWLLPRFGYAPFFVALSLLDILGAVILWSVVRAPRDA